MSSAYGNGLLTIRFLCVAGMALAPDQEAPIYWNSHISLDFLACSDSSVLSAQSNLSL